MARMIKKEWRTVQIPEGIIKQIEDYIITDDAADKGLTSISACVSYFLRLYLDKK